MPNTVDDAQFLYLCIKHSEGMKVNYQAVADELGKKKHTTYCRFNELRKKMDAELAASGATSGVFSSAAGGNNAINGNPTPKRKRAPTAKKNNEGPNKKGKSNSDKIKKERDDDHEKEEEEELAILANSPSDNGDGVFGDASMGGSVFGNGVSHDDFF